MIKQNETYKVALIGDCLANGGAEKVHALLSIYFQKIGFEVCNCVFVDWVTYDHAGSVLNLGKIKPNSNVINRRVTRFLAFRKFIKTNHFDAVIDFRMRTSTLQELLISKFCYPKNAFYTVHSGILDFYFPKKSWVSRYICKHKKIIAVSKAIQREILSKAMATQVSSIYNPVDLASIAVLKEAFFVPEENYILAIGRMNEDVKQFDKLITAYSQSTLPAKHIKLIILGDGANQLAYERLAAQLGLKDLVQFKGFVQNPFPYYQKALFTVLSSRNEGFPNAILESFAVGTPVVSFDCFSGPNEIIVDRQNGLLVANQNFEKLSQAMSSFIEDIHLYQHCKQNTKAAAAPFDIEIIGKHWLKLVKNTVS